MRYPQLLETQAERHAVSVAQDHATPPFTPVDMLLSVVRARTDAAGVGSAPLADRELRVHCEYIYNIKASLLLRRNSEKQIAAVGDVLHIAAWIDNAIAGAMNVTA